VGDGEGHREEGHQQPGPLGERAGLFDVEAAFAGEVADQAGAAQVVVLVLADAAGEQALAERAQAKAPVPRRWMVGRISRSIPRLRRE
jgi:hypothetical protein